MPYLSYLAACILICSASTVAQDRAPQFTDYPARVVRARRSQRVQIHSTPDTVCFRTMLREVAREGRLFAGQYAVGYWGCGTGLRLGIVDLYPRAYVIPSKLVPRRAS